MGDFISFSKDILSSSLFQIMVMIVVFVFTLILLVYRIFKLAIISFVFFLLILFAWLSGPMGKDMIEKFQKKRPPTYQFPDEIDKEKLREQRELIKQYKDAMKEMRDGQKEF